MSRMKPEAQRRFDVIQGDGHPREEAELVKARGRLRLRLRREPTNEEAVEDAVKAAVAAMYQNWAASGTPPGSGPSAA